MTLRTRLNQLRINNEDYNRFSPDEDSDDDASRVRRYRQDHPMMFPDRGRNYVMRSKETPDSSKTFRAKELAFKSWRFRKEDENHYSVLGYTGRVYTVQRAPQEDWTCSCCYYKRRNDHFLRDTDNNVDYVCYHIEALGILLSLNHVFRTQPFPGVSPPEECENDQREEFESYLRDIRERRRRYLRRLRR